MKKSKKKPINGFLSRVVRNVHTLDEAIESVRVAPDGEKATERRARLKLLRDLIDEQDRILQGLKAHMLGRSESGGPNEPPNVYTGNYEVEFERAFSKFVSKPWTEEDLMLQCSECHRKGIDVSEHAVSAGRDSFGLPTIEHRNLCPSCFEKLSGKRGVV